MIQGINDSIGERRLAKVPGRKTDMMSQSATAIYR